MTDQPIFLTLADVLEIHLYQLVHFGGTSGIRDLNLLKSAVAMPQMSFGDVMLHKDIYEMAAAYLFHLVENHPFLDGNKRTGAMAAIVFLDVNGIEFNATDEDFTEFRILKFFRITYCNIGLLYYLCNNIVIIKIRKGTCLC